VIRELDRVVLTKDVAEYGLREGDIGTVVHCYPDGAAYEVEFVAASGRTVAVLTLENGEVRPMDPQEISHARRLTPA
jgi:hypothetical protein